MYQRKPRIANFTFGALPVFSGIMPAAYYTVTSWRGNHDVHVGIGLPWIVRVYGTISLSMCLESGQPAAVLNLSLVPV